MRTLNRKATPFLVEHDAGIPMRDATIPRADIYRRDDPTATVPTLLVRSPYGEGSFRGAAATGSSGRGWTRATTGTHPPARKIRAIMRLDVHDRRDHDASLMIAAIQELD